MSAMYSCAVDCDSRAVIAPHHCNRLHRQSAFAACENHVFQCNRYHLRPLLGGYRARTHSSPMVRWFFAPIQSNDAPNAKCPIVKQPSAIAAILNCFSMRTQTDQSLLSYITRAHPIFLCSTLLKWFVLVFFYFAIIIDNRDTECASRSQRNGAMKCRFRTKMHSFFFVFIFVASRLSIQSILFLIVFWFRRWLWLLHFFVRGSIVTVYFHFV